jgi:cell division protein FtsI/penicillin-binding protein 2
VNEDNFLKRVIQFITNRCLILFIVIALSFYLLLSRLFYLQIVKGSDYSKAQAVTRTQPVSIPASRGNIYDRLGRPLAINNSSYTIEMDPSVVSINSYNLYDLVNLLEENGETIVDTFPISREEPYYFNTAGSGVTEEQWKKDMDFTGEEAGLTARESFDKLREKFFVEPWLPDSEARKILNLCAMLYRERYRSWNSITIAYDVKPETIAAIEEDNGKFEGISADVRPLRYYPEGKYFSLLLGYIAKITEDELNDDPEGFYSNTDLVGRSGLESSLETLLRGERGSYNVEITAAKKVIRRLPDQVNAIQGNNVYLTIDKDLQKSSYDILEEMLKTALINELQGKGGAQNPITLKKFFRSLAEGNVLNIRRIMEMPEESEGSPSLTLRRYVLNVNPDASWASENDGIPEIREILSKGVDDGTVTPQQILLVMLEQGVISGDEQYANDIARGRVRPLTVILNKLESGEITPQMTNLDPCSGSIVVLDVKSGDVLAAVGYPSYDNNKLVNNLDYEYFVKQLGDPTGPLTNRPFLERRAPGSTLKMITAIAALEKGALKPTERIYDQHTFTSAGQPYLSCWSAISHGSLNVSQALEVSCNYFFCEAAYRLGNAKNGNKLDSIGALNEYMAYFGLNSETGAEIGEYRPIMSSPDFKDSKKRQSNPDASLFERDWYDGDTVQSAIGQGFNSFTAAHMAKYFMTLATHGVRYQLHLVDNARTADGSLIQKTQPEIEESQLEIKESTWDAVYKGMLLVTEGAKGTGAGTFRGFPIRLAGKTGTAQEITNRNDHSSFGAFAPYEDPRIAIYVSIPFGDTKAMPALASQIARRVMETYFQTDIDPQYPASENALIQ